MEFPNHNARQFIKKTEFDKETFLFFTFKVILLTIGTHTLNFKLFHLACILIDDRDSLSKTL